MTQPPVLALVDSEMRSMGCNLWRVFQPFAELQRHGYPASWGWNQDVRTALLAAAYTVIVMARLSWQPHEQRMSERWMATNKRLGRVFVSEWDDNVFDDRILDRAVELNQTEGRTEQRILAEIEMRRHVLQLADGVTVSTRHLADTVSRWTDKPVVVVPNAIDLEWWRKIQSQTGPRVAPGLTIGWAGGARPDRDVAMMAEAWGRVARQRSDVRFVLIGHQASAVDRHVPAERLVRLEWLPVETYPINLVNVDIGCCPLAAESFNRSKSPIKAYEYAASGAVVVASPTVYKDIITHGDTGYLAETVDDWEAALLDLVDSANRRNRLAQRLLAVVEREHSLAVNWWRWPAAWSEIIADTRERQQYGANHGRIAAAVG